MFIRELIVPLARSTLKDAIVVLWLQNGSFLIKGWIEIWPLRSLSNLSSKGQLISKCPFLSSKSDQKTNEIFVRFFALASKKRSNQKNKGTLQYH